MFFCSCVLQTFDMLSKSYLAALGLSTAVMGFLTYYSWSWLQSIGQPAAAVEGYQYHSNLAWITLWISTTILLIIGNAVLWAARSAWAMWLTFLYFAVFVVIGFFWLEREYMRFAETFSTFSPKPILGAALIVLMAAIVFFDQFIIIRLRSETYPEQREKEI